MNHELFKPGIIGQDLFNTLLLFCNQTKEKLFKTPSLKMSDITSIYKNKNSRLDLKNDRGIFSVVKLRSVIDKMVYQDIYDMVDSEMSDSNVGARRERNIRDNLFVIYAVMAEVLHTGEDVELALYDLAQCFESMWWQETSNDLWDKGCEG